MMFTQAVDINVPDKHHLAVVLFEYGVSYY
jgi:hypothetical protein